jgi:hypothetical protein
MKNFIILFINKDSFHYITNKNQIIGYMFMYYLFQLYIMNLIQRNRSSASTEQNRQMCIFFC